MDQVDYFAYEFDQLDLHSTWRRATKQKNSVSNGRRLENASWRRFFQQHFRLKTLSAAELGLDRQSNWLVGPFIEFEALRELEDRTNLQQPVPRKENEEKSCVASSNLKRNKANHHSLTRLVDLTV
jgi:hypothetical protein